MSPSVYVVTLELKSPECGKFANRYHFDAHPTQEGLLALLNGTLKYFDEAIAINPDVTQAPIYKEAVALRDLAASLPIPRLEGDTVGRGAENDLGYLFVEKHTLYPA
jgi:hypothetical protein